MVVVDSLTGVETFAAHARRERPIGILIDIDMGLGRDGLVDPAEAVALARRIAELPQLRYRGVQAYYGHLQHVKALADRHARVAEQWTRLSRFLEALSAAGFAPEIISGGGTGTHHLDLEHGPFTEIQPGSYLFMDKQYGEVEIAPGGSPFQTSLTIAARVVSVAQPDRVIVDAGSKALSTDYGPAARRQRRAGRLHLPVHGRRARRDPRPGRRQPAAAWRHRRADRAALRSDRQSARPLSRHARRPPRRHLAHRSAGLLG